MEDAIVGFQAAPLWAQIAMALFACTAVFMIVGPSIRKRRFRRHYNAIAHDLGQPPPGGDWPFAFRVAVEGRASEVRYDFRGTSSRGTSGSYRGPHGYLLTTATPLAGTRWPLHQVDISRVDGMLSRLVAKQQATGDPEFDARYMVVEDGLPVRAGWLNGDTRHAISRFMSDAPPAGLLWIQEGELRYVMQNPWTGIDGQVIRTLLERQAALASALERTG